jgi:phospholipase C
MNHYQNVMHLFVAITLTLASTICAGATQLLRIQSPLPVSSPVPAFSHVFIIVMENQEASSIVGNSAAPYLNSLAAQYARAANFYGTGHPSLPNYLALTGGSTFNISSDCNDCFINATNIADQIELAGRSWKAYMESMPQPCFVGDAGPLYAQRHNPFIYYDDIRNNPARCNKIVPLDQLTADLQSNSVPDYVWITPNLCNDMHDCSISTGDDWLKTWVPRILASPAWKDNGVLFITFDEGTSDVGPACRGTAGGRVDTLVISPLVQRGFTSQTSYDHFALLHTIEAAWGLPLLGNAADNCAAPMADFFARNKNSLRGSSNLPEADKALLNLTGASQILAIRPGRFP